MPFNVPKRIAKETSNLQNRNQTKLSDVRTQVGLVTWIFFWGSTRQGPYKQLSSINVNRNIHVNLGIPLPPSISLADHRIFVL